MQQLRMQTCIIETKIILENCAPFTDCISKINNREVDYGKDIDVTMSMYSLTGHSNNYCKTSGSLWLL